LGIIAQQADQREDRENENEQADDLVGTETSLPGFLLFGGPLLFSGLHWGDYSTSGLFFLRRRPNPKLPLEKTSPVIASTHWVRGDLIEMN
jgi:hypothetical protein